MSIKCRLKIHSWSKWGKIVKAYGGLTQFRACKECNKIQYIGCYGNQACPDDVNETTDQSRLEQEQVKK